MVLPYKRAPGVGWLHKAWIRGLTFWPAKVIGMTLAMTLFFAAYFWVLRHPHFPVTTMPVSYTHLPFAWNADAKTWC